MKKVISFLLLIATTLSFYFVYWNDINIYSNRFQEIESNLPNAKQLMMPISIDSKDKNKSYEAIKKILDKYDGGIYYTRLAKNETTIIKYIYDISDMYLSNIEILNGKKLTEDTMESTKYLSTEKNNNELQIGRIATLNKNLDVEIKPVKNIINNIYSFSGTCTVAFKNKINIDDFISELETELDIKGIVLMDKMPMGVNQNNDYKIIVVIIYIIVMLLILYELLNSYKKIGVKKLLGYSSKNIYVENIFNLIKVNLSISLVTTAIMSSIFFNQFNVYVSSFILKFLLYIIIETLMLVGICSIAYSYIFFIKVPEMLKNKKPLTGLIIINYVAKIVCLIAVMFFVVQGVKNTENIKALFNKSYKNWEVLDDFAIVPSSKIPISITLDNDLYNNYLKIQKEMYKEFNRIGAIYAGFNEFSPGTREMRLAETKYYYESDNVYVNPNYLEQYSISDSEGNKVSISNDDEQQIILIPDKYKHDEKRLLKYAEFFKEQKFYSTGINQSTKIIWINSNQKVFTASVDISPNDGNEIIDPIIHVITNKNIGEDSYDFIQGIEGAPFKIKADKGKTVENTIKEVFSKYGIEDYLGAITPVNEQIASSIKVVKDNIKTSILFMSLLLGVLIVIILQNSLNYYDKYKQKLAVEKLTGYNVLDKHKNYLVGIVACWSIAFIMGVLIYKSSILTTTLIVVAGIMIEASISLVILRSVERKKIVKIIKGE